MLRSSRTRSAAAWIAVLGLSLSLLGLTSRAGAQSSTDDPGLVEAGKTVFEMACAGCHGADGMGTERGRPLTDIASQQPDRSVHIMSVTDGIGFMPAFGENLDAEQIDAAVAYLRLTFVSEDAAADEADAGPEELAETGAETPLLAVGGITLIAAGALLVTATRRLD